MRGGDTRTPCASPSKASSTAAWAPEEIAPRLRRIEFSRMPRKASHDEQRTSFAA